MKIGLFKSRVDLKTGIGFISSNIDFLIELSALSWALPARFTYERSGQSITAQFFCIVFESYWYSTDENNNDDKDGDEVEL